MRVLHVGGAVGTILFAMVVLTGCSSILPEDIQQESNELGELASLDQWLVVAQGQGGPPKCVKALASGQAKKLADKALKEKLEVRALVETLKGKGKKLSTIKAHGCKVRRSQSSGQGLIAMQTTGDEATLVEVPAGSEAALYLLENPDDGNYWASIREAADVGERLVHLEVGLDGGTQVQGMSGNLGEMSLLLPDHAGVQEISGQVEQLLANSAPASANLSASQSEQLDWTKAEVILDESNLILADDGSEEMDALIMVPPVDSQGQELWGRTQPPYDGVQALYAKVAVKKVGTPGRTRPSLQVTTPPAQVKRGSELSFQEFDLCPYSQYGRVAAFSKPLCSQWEQKAALKVQGVTFDRGMKGLPAVHNQVQQSSGTTKRGVMAIAGPEGNLIVAGMKNIDVVKLTQLYEKTVKGQGSTVEGQDALSTVLREILKRAGVPAFIISLIFDVVDYWQSLSDAKRNEVKNILLNLKLQLDHPDQFMTEIQNRYNDTPAFRELVDKMIAQLRTIHPNASPGELLSEALDIFYHYMSSLAQSGNLTLVDQALDMFGAGVVIAFGLLDQNQLLDPSLAGQMLLALQALRNSGTGGTFNRLVGGVEVLVWYLAVSAAQIIYNTNVGVGVEGIARVQQFLFELVPQLQAKGWRFNRIDPEEQVGFAFEASIVNEGVETFVYGMLEPNLQKQEVDAMVRAIQSAAEQVELLRANGSPCFQQPGLACQFNIVEVINNAEQGAVDTLCSRIQNEVTTYVPIVIIGPDGNVACSKNTTEQEALELCMKMGYCSSSQVSSNPAVDDSTAVLLPVPPAVLEGTATCPKWKLCLT